MSVNSWDLHSAFYLSKNPNFYMHISLWSPLCRVCSNCKTKSFRKTLPYILNLYVSYTKICFLKYARFSLKNFSTLENINSLCKSFTINNNFQIVRLTWPNRESPIAIKFGITLLITRMFMYNFSSTYNGPTTRLNIQNKIVKTTQFIFQKTYIIEEHIDN